MSAYDRWFHGGTKLDYGAELARLKIEAIVAEPDTHHSFHEAKALAMMVLAGQQANARIFRRLTFACWCLTAAAVILAVVSVVGMVHHT